ncbi:MAG: YqhA family protein [Planctomyces sp.]|nr:YqhA family protein [Planctomyces sp.]
MLRTLLVLGRYLLVIPVIGSLLLTVGVVLMGAGVIVERAWNVLQNGEFSLKAAKMMSLTVVQTIDFFLVGALGYITAVGIYNLFITSDEEQLLKRIRIEKLKDLEDKIIGVVVAALAVSFLGQVSDATKMEDILYAGIGISLMIAALCLFMYFAGRSEK